MPHRLARRLLEAHHRQFVGRSTECDLFKSSITAPVLPFVVLHVYGPGGVGKSSLLQEFRYQCHQTNAPEYYIDARIIEATPQGFLSALGEVLGHPETDPIAVLEAAEGRTVLLIDTIETLGPLERWLRSVFLPQLSQETLVVMAGRQPLSLGWRSDPGWKALIHSIPLRNLGEAECRTYLTMAGLPEDQHTPVLQFTHGHALALSLVAEVFAQRPGVQFSPAQDPDVIKSLLDRFVMKVPSQAHRTALEACAMVRFTTESMLSTMVAIPDAHELFEWLRGLSFIESGPLGLYPHDLARSVLVADLRWRNPDWYKTLHHRARVFYNNRLQQADAQAQRYILEEYVYLHRDNPLVKPFFVQLQSEWQGQVSLLTDQAGAADFPLLREMVVKHEGPEAAACADLWFERQPEQVQVYRDHTGRPAGFILLLALESTRPEDRAQDPATAAAWSYLQRHAPLRPGERATLFRFWMAEDSHQAVSPVQSLAFVSMVRHYLTTPNLAFTLLPCITPDFWAFVFAYADLARLTEADYEVDGKPYGVYGHDWRATPPAAWLDLLATREVSDSLAPVKRPTAAPIAVLDESAFADAVKGALNSYARPHTLRDNPLLRSRLLYEALDGVEDEADQIEALQRLLRETADQLKASRRQSKFYRALDRTYLRPAPTQEQAAELLNLPFSTYRRHLKAAIEAITERLWQQEIGG